MCQARHMKPQGLVKREFWNVLKYIRAATVEKQQRRKTSIRVTPVEGKQVAEWLCLPAAWLRNTGFVLDRSLVVKWVCKNHATSQQTRGWGKGQPRTLGQPPTGEVLPDPVKEQPRMCFFLAACSPSVLARGRPPPSSRPGGASQRGRPPASLQQPPTKEFNLHESLAPSKKNLHERPSICLRFTDWQLIPCHSAVFSA